MRGGKGDNNEKETKLGQTKAKTLTEKIPERLTRRSICMRIAILAQISKSNERNTAHAPCQMKGAPARAKMVPKIDFHSKIAFAEFICRLSHGLLLYGRSAIDDAFPYFPHFSSDLGRTRVQIELLAVRFDRNANSESSTGGYRCHETPIRNRFSN